MAPPAAVPLEPAAEPAVVDDGPLFVVVVGAADVGDGSSLGSSPHAATTSTTATSGGRMRWRVTARRFPPTAIDIPVVDGSGCDDGDRQALDARDEVAAEAVDRSIDADVGEAREQLLEQHLDLHAGELGAEAEV